MEDFHITPVDQRAICLVPKAYQSHDSLFKGLVLKHFNELNFQEEVLQSCLIEILTIERLEDQLKHHRQIMLYSSLSQEMKATILGNYQEEVTENEGGLCLYGFREYYFNGCCIMPFIEKRNINQVNTIKRKTWGPMLQLCYNQELLLNQSFNEPEKQEKKLKELLKKHVSSFKSILGNSVTSFQYVLSIPIIDEVNGLICPVGSILICLNTITELNEDFCKKMMCELKLLWFKEFNKISGFTRNVDKNKILKKMYIPDFSKSKSKDRLTKLIKGSQYTLEDYFMHLYEKDAVLLEDFENRLTKMIHFFTPILIEQKKWVNGEINEKYDGVKKLITLPSEIANKYFWQVQGVGMLKGAWNPEKFIQFLLKRAWFIMAFIVYELEPRVILSLRETKKIVNEFHAPYHNNSTTVNYALNTQLVLPYYSTDKKLNWGVGLERFVEDIKFSLSQPNREFIEECKKYKQEYLEN